MPGNKKPDQAKQIIKQFPGVQELIRLKHRILLIRELSNLIKEKRIVVVHPYSSLGDDDMKNREKFNQALKEWIDQFGIIHLRKKTETAINLTAGSILLFMPQALLGIPATHEEYLRLVGHQTRKAIRLAEKQGYEFKEFIWNDHLNEIYEINTSKEVRQSEPMRGWYREPVQPRHYSSCELMCRKYYGAFKDRRLWAYSHLWITGDFASPIHILGHAHHLQYGIMNGLISHMVGECTRNPQIQWIYYGGYEEGSSLAAFKKHAGFQKYAMFFDIEGDQELLDYSEQKIKTIWRI